MKHNLYTKKFCSLVRAVRGELVEPYRMAKMFVSFDRLRTNGVVLLIGVVPCTVFPLFEYDRAISASQQGDWKKAQQFLTPLVTKFCDEPQIAYDAGVAAFNLKEFEQARAYFMNAAQFKDSPPQLQEQAYFNAGNSYVELKQLQHAIHAYEKVLEINPNNEKAKHNLEVVKKMLQEQQKQQQEEQEKEQEENQDNKEQDQDEKSEKQQNKDEQDSQEQENQNDQDDAGVQEESESDQDKKQSGNEKEQESGKQDKQQESKEKKEQKNQQQPQQNKSKDEKGKSDSDVGNEQQERKDQGKNKPEEQSKNGGKQGQEQKQAALNEKEASGKKELDAWLAQILEESEKKDAQSNKKIIRATVGKRLAGQDGQNCW